MRKFLITVCAWVGVLGLTVWNFANRPDLVRAETAFDVRKDVNEALRLAMDVLDQNPNQPRAALIVAKCLSLRVFPREAEPYYETAEKGQPLSRDDWNTRAQGWSRSHLLNEAIAMNERMLEIYPDDIPTLQRLAALQRQANLNNDALRTAKRIHSLPNGALPGSTLELMLIVDSSSIKATDRVEAFERYLLADPILKSCPMNTERFWIDFGLALQTVGNPKRLREVMALALKTVDRVELIDLMGYALLQEGQFDQAEREFRKSIQRDESRGSPWYYLGRLAIQRSKPDEAVKLLETADRLLPDFYEIVYNLSIAYKMANQNEKAALCQARAQKLQPKMQSGGMGQ